MDLRVLIARRFRWSPHLFAMVVHLLHQREFSTFRNPQTFTEMLMAKKLWDKNPLYPTTVDKYAVRSYAASKVGNEVLVPMIQIADSPDEIDFENLPRPCVIKATHGGDMTIILKPGDTIDVDAIIKETKGWLKRNFYDEWLEWPYRTVKPRLIVEEFIGADGVVPTDYKFYVFAGRVAMLQVDSDRFTGHKVNLMDRDWNEFDVTVPFPRVDPTPPAPDNFPEMVRIAETIAADIRFARVDLYSVGDKIYFGEITHFPGVGRILHRPREFDHALGQLWRYGKPMPKRFLKQREPVLTS